MDTFERRFAASLKDIAHHVPDDHSAAEEAPTSRDGARHRIVVPLLAAAAVTAILGIAAWQTDLGRTPREAAPAEPGGVYPSQTTNDSPSIARNDVVERLESYRDAVGFGAIVLDRGTNSVTVLWDGTPPDSLREMEGTQPNGVQLNLAETAYSAREFSDQTRLVSTMAGIEKGVVLSVGPSSDLSTLVVEIDGSKVAQGSETARELEQRISDAVTPPVQFDYLPGGNADRG